MSTREWRRMSKFRRAAVLRDSRARFADEYGMSAETIEEILAESRARFVPPSETQRLRRAFAIVSESPLAGSA